VASSYILRKEIELYSSVYFIVRNTCCMERCVVHF